MDIKISIFVISDFLRWKSHVPQMCPICAKNVFLV